MSNLTIKQITLKLINRFNNQVWKISLINRLIYNGSILNKINRVIVYPLQLIKYLTILIYPTQAKNIMKPTSFFQSVIRQISKNSIQRNNLINFTKMIRKQSQNVSTAQLLYLYRELQRIKVSQAQFHESSTFNHHKQRNKINQGRPVIKYQSFQKHAVICLQDIAIKFKQKNGFEQGVDLLKLCYFRLLNAIEYHLPYIHILEQFREQFLLKQLGQEIIDYVQLISKDPKNFNQTFIDTVNLVIDTVGQQLQNINPLQFPYLKSILIKSKGYCQYNIQQNLLKKLDLLINQNKYAYTFKQLQNCISSQRKNIQTLSYVSLITRDPIEKRVFYIYQEGFNQNMESYDKSYNCSSNSHQLKKEVNFPGKNILEDNLNFAIKKIDQIALYKPYPRLFQSFISDSKQIQNTLILKSYVNFNFKYALNAQFQSRIFEEIRCIFKANFLKEKNEDLLKIEKFQILNLIYTFTALCCKRIKQNYGWKFHFTLHQQLDDLNIVQSLKLQHLEKIFQRSFSNFIIDQTSYKDAKALLIYLSKHIQKLDETNLSESIKSELEYSSSKQKKQITNHLILWILSSIKAEQMHEQTGSFGRVLQILSKAQYKKFSPQSANIYKILALLPNKNCSIKN